MKQIPKDRQIIIITKHNNLVARWSPADRKFIYANLQVDMYDGKWNMYYFENEYIDEDYILGWREL